MAIKKPIDVERETGALVKPVYSERTMKCWVITESELKQISLANLGMTATFGIGSALFAFGLDIYKDLTLSDDVPATAQVLAEVVQPLCFYLGLAFWVLSAVLLVWRISMVRTVKAESS